jgi:hypothetical protein
MIADSNPQKYNIFVISDHCRSYSANDFIRLYHSFSDIEKGRKHGDTKTESG